MTILINEILRLSKLDIVTDIAKSFEIVIVILVRILHISKLPGYSIMDEFKILAERITHDNSNT
jgi:hypothetical protein